MTDHRRFWGGTWLVPRRPDGHIDWPLYEGNVLGAIMLGLIIGVVLAAFR